MVGDVLYLYLIREGYQPIPLGLGTPIVNMTLLNAILAIMK